MMCYYTKWYVILYILKNILLILYYILCTNILKFDYEYVSYFILFYREINFLS